jgi:tryptophan synthase beta chain
MERQQLNVFRMRLLGAEVREVAAGTATLKVRGTFLLGLEPE